MIHVTTSIEVNVVSELNCPKEISFCSVFSLLLNQVVQVCHVSPVMLAIVKFQNFTTHDRLKLADLKGKMLEGDSAWLDGLRHRCEEL